MAKVIAAVAVVVLVCSSCADKRSTIERIHDAARGTLGTNSYTVRETSESLGETFHRSVVEHIGQRARVKTGEQVHGVFIGDTVYVADNQDPGSFFRCGKKLEDGTLREFDHVSKYLRAALKATRVTRRGDRYVFPALLPAKNGRTEGDFTLDGGRVKRLKVTTFPTGPNLTPPQEVTFVFDYGSVPEITAPPDEVVEEAAAC